MFPSKMREEREAGLMAHIDISEAVKKLLLAAAYTTGFGAEVTVCVTKDTRCQFFSYPPSSQLDGTIKNVCMLKSNGPVEQISEVFVPLDVSAMDETSNMLRKVEPDLQEPPTEETSFLPHQRSSAILERKSSTEQGLETLVSSTSSSAITLPSQALRLPELRVRLERLPSSPAPASKRMKPRPQTPLLRWVAAETEVRVKWEVSQTGDSCRICNYQTSKRRIKIHIRQHFCKLFCPCGFKHPSRDAVYEHQVAHNRTEEHGGQDGAIYSVDEVNYPAFLQHMKWKDLPPFGPCVPTNLGGKKKRPPAQHTASQEMEDVIWYSSSAADWRPSYQIPKPGQEVQGELIPATEIKFDPGPDLRQEWADEERPVKHESFKAELCALEDIYTEKTLHDSNYGVSEHKQIL